MVDLIDTSGGRPRLRAGALISLFVGTSAYAYLTGWVGLIGTIGGGIRSGLDGLGTFLSSMLEGLLAIPSGAIGSAFDANAALIGSFGAWGIVVAIIEVGALVVLVLWTLSTVVDSLIAGAG